MTTNIADSPSGIAAHLAKSAHTSNRRRSSHIHLREADDGFWTRVSLTTTKAHGWFTTRLSFDLHKEHEHGEAVRMKIGAPSIIVARQDGPGRYSDKRLAEAFDAAAAQLTANPNLIAQLLEANGQ